MDTMNQIASPDDVAVPLLDRNLQRAIKKMERNTLEGLLNDIFERGRRSDIEEVQSNILPDEDRVLELREVEKEIRTIKGIGEKRAEEIMRIFERHLDMSDDQTEASTASV